MSAAFKLAKKKVNQHDLRRIMQEQKLSRNSGNSNESKIDSPFAKYDNGQLTCQLCKSVVRSAAVWKVHVNSKQHKENLSLAKQLKEKLEAKETPAIEDRLAALKRMRSVTETSEKRLKTQNESVDGSQKIKDSVTSQATSAIPDDFFDSKSKNQSNNKQSSTASTANESEDKNQIDESLPEGFFDDPVKDAKARHVEVRDQAAEEWERFQREIKEAEALSMNIINEEQEEATAERQIDEIDAQIKNWSRVLELEKKKEIIESKLKQGKLQNVENQITSIDDDDDMEEEIPEFFDWRAKKSHK
ncbi:CLUMA_CG004614, isoform A [Clunio marinus]|uniref:Zinc finger protein 830 n=1 Tax=Clunio marinus TaxID=568069 RepID=A0A1J1HSE3_9DIPT|nr:CLUMA_CG004614, isoform A [Clunio marinus]